jgi:hypothetical protein
MNPATFTQDDDGRWYYTVERDRLFGGGGQTGANRAMLHSLRPSRSVRQNAGFDPIISRTDRDYIVPCRSGRSREASVTDSPDACRYYSGEQYSPLSRKPSTIPMMRERSRSESCSQLSATIWNSASRCFSAVLRASYLRRASKNCSFSPVFLHSLKSLIAHYTLFKKKCRRVGRFSGHHALEARAQRGAKVTASHRSVPNLDHRVVAIGSSRASGLRHDGCLRHVSNAPWLPKLRDAGSRRRAAIFEPRS